jgi:sigma-54 specific flagellar transcriptional regulator A
VRIVAATHRNLETMITDGKFREDLFYRLNVFPIETPALRERAQDIPLLLLELVSRMKGNNEVGVTFNEEALRSLTAHSWPGNVRELSNLVERLAILYPNGLIDLQKLPSKYQYGEVAASDSGMSEEQSERQALNELFSTNRSDEQSQGDTTNHAEHGLDQSSSVPTVSAALPSDGVNLKEYLSDLEINLITQALEQQEWVVARAADQLGMRRTTLVEKMRKYEITRQN